MTLNLWGYRGDWPARRDRLIQVMQVEEVDVVMLQEVAERAWRPNQAEEIAQLTGYAMAFVPAQRYFIWPSVAHGLAVLSRFPISNQLVSEVFPPTGLFPAGTTERRIAQRLELSLDGMSVVLYNTHFPLDATARLTAAYRLWRQVVQEEAVLVIVGGDFNAKPSEDSLNFLQGKIAIDTMRGGLTDAWATAGIGPAETFPASRPQARIDYVLYQAEPTVIVQEARVVGQHPLVLSDHAAVMATFSISPTRDRALPFEEEPIGSLEPTGGGRLGL